MSGFEGTQDPLSGTHFEYELKPVKGALSAVKYTSVWHHYECVLNTVLEGNRLAYAITAPQITGHAAMLEFKDYVRSEIEGDSDRFSVAWQADVEPHMWLPATPISTSLGILDDRDALQIREGRSVFSCYKAYLSQSAASILLVRGTELPSNGFLPVMLSHFGETENTIEKIVGDIDIMYGAMYSIAQDTA